jgi:subtilisin family serine protease
MLSKPIIILLILPLILSLTLTAQNTPLEVYVHDNYIEKPLESVLVTVFQNGTLIDSAYTDINGIAFISGVTSVSGSVGLPTTMSLSHNYPNPFREETNVEIGVPEAQTITATVYNILGQRVASEQLPLAGGYYTLNLSLGHLPTGVYFLRLDGRESQVVKLLKMGRGVRTSGPMLSVSASSLPGSAALGKMADDAYTLRAVKDRYDLYEALLEQPLGRGVAVPLARNNTVEFIVVDGDDNPVSKQLKIRTSNETISITTPHTLTLKSGVYAAVGEVEQDVSLERTVEIPSVDTTVVLAYDGAGVKLVGVPDAPATDATYDLYIPIVYPEETISIDSDYLDDGKVLRTEIEIVLKPDVTIAEVNGVLDKYDAQIVSMLQGNTIFIVRVPDPGDVTSLNKLIADIQNENIVLFALKSLIVGEPEDILPNSIPSSTQEFPVHIGDFRAFDHHLAARAHGAWNLRDAITTMVDIRPRIVIADYFGDGPPGRGYNASYINTDFAAGDVHSHGYHVLGIISGMYDRVGSLTIRQNSVVGLFPDWLMVRAVDIRYVTTTNRTDFLIIQRINNIIRDNDAVNVILNTSLSLGNLDADQANIWALAWIKKVRGITDYRTVGAGIENRFLHFTAAGNIRYDGGGNIIRWPAIRGSDWAFAALGDVTSNGNEVPNLTNTFVVENRVNTLHHNSDTLRQRPLPGCANNSSIMGGNLSGMGTNVWSYGNFTDGVHYSDPSTSSKSGTSMATPQAAGVAAYVWAVNPSLSVSEVMNIIRRTVEERATTTLTPGFSCNQVAPQHVIDAYAAVLLAGGSDARRVLLDIKGNGVFDHNDIEEFLGVYLDEEKAGTLDYSRYDLNGDGFTGGARADRFDLSIDGEYSVVPQHIEGETVYYNENTLTDLQVLCYYSYSDIYGGDTDQRRALLENVCSGLPAPVYTRCAVDITINPHWLVTPSSGNPYEEKQTAYYINNIRPAEGTFTGNTFTGSYSVTDWGDASKDVSGTITISLNEDHDRISHISWTENWVDPETGTSGAINFKGTDIALSFRTDFDAFYEISGQQTCGHIIEYTNNSFFTPFGRWTLVNYDCDSNSRIWVRLY